MIKTKMEPCQFFDKKYPRSLLYRLFRPALINGKQYPLLVSLHSASGNGQNNSSQINSIVSFFISRKIQKIHPCFVFAPQCPPGKQWLNTTFKTKPYDHYNQKEIPESEEMKMIVDVIQKLVKEFPIDKNRIYIIGFSMGSSGTWDIISRYPNLFAAAVPISGVSDTMTASKIIGIPIWAFHGEEDNVAPVRLNKEMQTIINKSGGNCKLTIFKNTGHPCAYKAIHFQGLSDWLFNQQK